MVYLGSGYFRRPLISKSLLCHPGDAELRASLAGPALGGVLLWPPGYRRVTLCLHHARGGRGDAVITGPGDEMAAAARGRLRVSHADRDQLIDTLKAAFVQGMLTKEELDARAALAFASRTYAELAALTADIAAGLIQDRPPRQPARPPEYEVADSSQNKFVNRCARVIIAVIALDVAFLTGNLGLFTGVAVTMAGVLLVVEICSRHESAPSSSDSRP